MIFFASKFSLFYNKPLKKLQEIIPNKKSIKNIFVFENVYNLKQCFHLYTKTKNKYDFFLSL